MGLMPGVDLLPLSFECTLLPTREVDLVPFPVSPCRSASVRRGSWGDAAGGKEFAFWLWLKAPAAARGFHWHLCEFWGGVSCKTPQEQLSPQHRGGQISSKFPRAGTRAAR